MDPVQQVIKLEQDIKKLQIQLGRRDAEIDDLRDKLRPITNLVEREEMVKRREDALDKKRSLMDMEMHFITREAVMCREILSSVLSRKEIKDRIWTESNYIPIYRESDGTQMGSRMESVVCRSREEHTLTPTLNPDAGTLESCRASGVR